MPASTRIPCVIQYQRVSTYRQSGYSLAAVCKFQEVFIMSYIWPLALVVISNILYNVCAKSVPEKLDPMASLTVTYSVGAAASYILYVALHGNWNVIREYTKLNWTPFVLGIVIVGLEAGYIYAFKAGWQVSTLAIVQASFLAAALLLVGYFAYSEALTANKIIGVVICLVGLYFINK